VCDHAQIIDPDGAIDAVVAALNEHDADEVTQLRAERAPALVEPPPTAAGFLAPRGGGTGDFVWGDIATHLSLTADHVRDLFDILTAAARKEVPVSAQTSGLPFAEDELASTRDLLVDAITGYDECDAGAIEDEPGQLGARINGHTYRIILIPTLDA